MKELGPVGGRAPGTPPRSANEHDTLQLGLKRNIAIIPMHRDFIFCLLVLVEFAYF